MESTGEPTPRTEAKQETARPSITCPACGRTSFNRNDVADGYCGYCHDWTAEWTPEQIARRQAERHGR